MVAGCDKGTYYVIPSGLTAANYDITFVAGYGSCYRGIQWTTSDPTRATVNNSGVVGMVDNAPDGEFIITATTTNDKKASLTFKIVDQKLTIDTDQLNLSLAQLRLGKHNTNPPLSVVTSGGFKNKSEFILYFTRFSLILQAIW